MRANYLVVTGFLLALVSASASSAPPIYRLTKLTLGGPSYVFSLQATGGGRFTINNAGQVTGAAYTAGGALHAFLWDGATMQDLNELGGWGGTSSYGTAINDSGKVTGIASTTGDAENHAFLWDGATMQDLNIIAALGPYGLGIAINASGQVMGQFGDERIFFWDGTDVHDLGAFQGLGGFGNAVNDSGTVVGTYYSPVLHDDPNNHAFLWDGATIHELNVPGARYSEAFDINNSGQTTGVVTLLSIGFLRHAVIWNGTTMMDLQALGGLGGAYSEGRAINASGQVTGSAGTAGGAEHAFLWDGATIQDLGTLGGTYSYGAAINASGKVTGRALTTGNAEYRAFLWDGATMQDLNDLIDPSDPLPAGVTLTRGIGINDSGQILLDGYTSGVGYHLYIASPVGTGGSDSDADGIANTVDTVPGTASSEFNDAATLPTPTFPTYGSITDRAGLTVTIEDAASPDGVRVVVGAGSGKVTLLVCGGFKLKVNAASEVIFTCGSVTVNVIEGAAEVVLDGIVTVISIPAGVTAKVTDNGDGTYLVQNVAGTGVVTVTVGGTQTTISSGGSQSYRVVYAFQGFFSPVDNLPTLNAAKAASAIPVKFSLGGNQGLDIFAAGYPKTQKIYCSTSAPLDDIEETVTAGSSSLSYSAGTGQYNYVWKTDKSWWGTCRQLILGLNDSSDHAANFKFK